MTSNLLGQTEKPYYTETLLMLVLLVIAIQDSDRSAYSSLLKIPSLRMNQSTHGNSIMNLQRKNLKTVPRFVLQTLLHQLTSISVALLFVTDLLILETLRNAFCLIHSLSSLAKEEKENLMIHYLQYIHISSQTNLSSSNVKII